MKKTTVETSVGVFVLVGLICVGYLTVKLGKLELMGGHYYRVHARFGTISGLKVGAVVDIAGVQVGQVERISLNKDDMAADVRMKIRDDVPLTDDAIASIKTAGLIGDKYIKIQPGGSDVILQDGDRIRETQSAIDIEELIGKYVFGGVDEKVTRDKKQQPAPDAQEGERNGFTVPKI